MFKVSPSTLAVFSHPNHEIAVYGLIRRMRPSLVFLTDGGGGARLAQTGQGLRAAGVKEGIVFFNHTEASFYQAILDKDVTFFDQVAAKLAVMIRDTEPSQILCDAVEYYNPIHDIIMPVTLRAIRKAQNHAQVFAVPLVYQKAAPQSGFVFQRALEGQRQFEETFRLQDEESKAKATVLSSTYTAVMAQMAFPPEVIEQGCLEEHLVPASSPLDLADLSCVIRYDQRGRMAQKEGLVERAITYAEHYLPLVRELLA